MSLQQSTPQRAAIYVRVSTPGQKEDGYSLDGQVDEGLALAEIEARPAPGLADDDFLALEQFAEEIAAGLATAGPAERHRLYKLLRLRGTVTLDPDNGIKIGRHRFAIDRRALPELRHERIRFSIRPGT